MKGLKTGLTGLALLFLLWQAASLLLGSRIIPPPLEVLTVLAGMAGDGGLILHVFASSRRLAAGLLLAVAIALPLGLLAGVSRRGSRLLTPLLYVLYPLPKIAFLPVFMLLFGLGDLSKIVLLFTAVVFQLTLGVRDAAGTIPKELHFAAQSMGLSAGKRIVKLYLPAALPGLFSALRIAVGIGMAVLFFGENYATDYGLGYLIMNNWIMVNYPAMFAGILALGMLAALVLFLLDQIERLVCPWRFQDGSQKG